MIDNEVQMIANAVQMIDNVRSNCSALIDMVSSRELQRRSWQRKIESPELFDKSVSSRLESSELQSGFEE